MIKRMTKTTSLLVAAAAIVSLMPATGANAATKLAVKEGTIEKAIAFEKGSYIFEGYKSDDDDAGIYFNDGSKDKMLDDVEDHDTLYKYGTKYAVAVDGSDEYMIDLSTGKVSDEDTDSDLTSTITTKLTTALRKTKRYEKSDNTADVQSVTKISNDQFGEVWYEYTATTSSEVKGSTNTVSGYTNQSGKYIDASVTANIYAFNGTKMVKVEEFNDETDGVTAELVNTTTIAEDSNYIYRVATVNLTGAYKLQKEADGARLSLGSAYYLQKISKAQGDKEDGAYLPKSVEAYEISNILGNSDADKAYDILDGISISGDATSNELVGIRVVDGSLYVTTFNGDDEATTTKFAMKRNEKIEVKSENKKYDVSVLKKSDDVDVDVDDIGAVSIDVDGNVWAVNKGKIYKSAKGGDFEVVYTCDRSINRLDVYNEGSLVAWDSEGDVYTTVQEGKDASKDEAEDIVGGDNTVKTGWDKNSDGTWVLYDAAGKKVTGWANVGGVWYYMDKTTAIMQTGWINDNGTWYYCNASGAMQTGWLLDGSTWYYCNASGAMQTGWLLDGSTWYYLQSNGAMKTGWLNDNGTWYYLNANGSMAANTTVDGYRLGSNGAWIR